MEKSQKINELKISLQVLKNLSNRYWSDDNFKQLSEYASKTANVLNEDKINDWVKNIPKKDTEKFISVCKHVIDLIESYIANN